MIDEEGFPALRGWAPRLGHVLRDRGLPDIDAELEQFAVDARRIPKRICNAHLANEVADLGWDTRSPAPRSSFPAPIEPEPGAMPAEHGLRFDDLQGLENVGSQRVHAHEHQPVNAGEGQTARGLAAEHIQLVPEHENFGLAVRDRKRPAKAHQIRLQRSIIAASINRFARAYQPTLVSGRDKGRACNASHTREALIGTVDDRLSVPLVPAKAAWANGNRTRPLEAASRDRPCRYRAAAAVNRPAAGLAAKRGTLAAGAGFARSAAMRRSRTNQHRPTRHFPLRANRLTVIGRAGTVRPDSSWCT